jgi:hypothetical protein
MMYRHCIYCSADLGTNESIERFPVGKRVAVDAEKGRLWAVCRKCARWNLAPIEERWEAVEDAERRFAGSRLRVQSENIGLAKLADGTRLIRIGKALPREMAAWRYGEQLQQRRKRYLVYAAVGAAVPLALTGLFVAGIVGSGASSLMYLDELVRNEIDARRAVYRLDAADASGEPVTLRRRHLSDVRLGAGEGGEPLVELPHGPDCTATSPRIVRGKDARRLLERALVVLNHAGARRKHVDRAVDALVSAGSADEYIGRAALERRTLAVDTTMESFKRFKRTAEHLPLTRDEAVALEMALHERAEHRALEGELTLLEAAWREAEELAGIADRLALAPEPSMAGPGVAR